MLIVLIVLITLCCGCIAPIFSGTTPTPTPSATVTPYPSQSTVLIYGHVYLDNATVKGAVVDAISSDGSDRRSAVTGNDGSYVLNVIKDNAYELTATYSGLQHSIWPIFQPGDASQYDIRLARAPYSSIEGTGYTTGGPSPGAYEHKPAAGYTLEARSGANNTNITSITDSDGKYSLEVEPGVQYNLTGAVTAWFYYRNYGAGSLGDRLQVTIHENETVLVDYVIPAP